MKTLTSKQIDRLIRYTYQQIGSSHCPGCFVATVRGACQEHGVECTTDAIAARVPRALRLTPRAAAMWSRLPAAH